MEEIKNNFSTNNVQLLFAHFLRVSLATLFSYLFKDVNDSIEGGWGYNSNFEIGNMLSHHGLYNYMGEYYFIVC